MNKEKAFSIIVAVVPAVRSRMDQYTVDTSEVDDELFEIFMEQINLNSEGIERAMTSGNLMEASKEAHSIKGMGGTAGFPELSVLAEELEHAAAAANVELVNTLYRAMKQWLDVCTS